MEAEDVSNKHGGSINVLFPLLQVPETLLQPSGGNREKVRVITPIPAVSQSDGTAVCVCAVKTLTQALQSDGTSATHYL